MLKVVKWWWEKDSNLRTQRGQIYSLLRLTTSLSHRFLKIKENTRKLPVVYPDFH